MTDNVTITFTGEQIGCLYGILDGLSNQLPAGILKSDQVDKLKELTEVCFQAMTKNLMGRINESDAMEDSYYKKQLDKLFPLSPEGISFQFASTQTTTKQMSLNEKSAQAILQLLTTLNLIQSERNPEFTKELQLILDEQYDMFNKQKSLSPRACRTILAYLYWQDGAEWEFIEEVWYKDSHWTHERCLKELRDKFSYGETDAIKSFITTYTREIQPKRRKKDESI
jgi:hypothetical protein